MSENPTFTFQRRHARENARGLAPINLRVTLRGKRSDLTTGIRCPAAYWLVDLQRVALPADEAERVPEITAAEVRQFNAELLRFGEEVSEHYKRLRRPELRGPVVRVTLKALAEAVRPERAPDAAPVGVLDMARKFVDTLWEAPEADRLAQGTLDTYECRLNGLRRYLQAQHTVGLAAAEINVPWCRRYERWLLSEAGGFGGTAMRKHVNFLQLTLNFAVCEGWLPTKTLHGYKYQTRLTPPACLSLPAAELARLAAAVPELCDAERRAVVGWLFCAYTGLSWADYSWFCSAPANYLFTDLGGEGEAPAYWLRMVRQKMRRRKPQGFSVPLFDNAADLLVAWRGRLPWSNDVNINKLLHRVEAELGLSVSLTTKLARATFSQVKRDEGYSDEAVAAMMGDSVSVMNKHYSRVSERRIALEMGRLRAGFTSPLGA